jgi:hypothetical protein
VNHPPGPALPQQIALWVSLGAIAFMLILTGATIRQATKWVAGFTPSWGRAWGALACSIVFSVLAQVTFLSIVVSGKKGAYDPGVILLVIPVAFFAQMLSYKSVLGGEGEEEISLTQAAAIIILQAVLAFLVLGAIVLCLFVVGLLGVAQLKQMRTPYGASPPWASPSSASDFNSPAFTTVAEAQREAVRRYPALGVKGSRMNQAYVDRYHLYQNTRPDFFQTTSWPVELADEIASDPSAR